MSNFLFSNVKFLHTDISLYQGRRFHPKRWALALFSRYALYSKRQNESMTARGWDGRKRSLSHALWKKRDVKSEQRAESIKSTAPLSPMGLFKSRTQRYQESRARGQLKQSMEHLLYTVYTVYTTVVEYIILYRKEAMKTSSLSCCTFITFHPVIFEPGVDSTGNKSKI